MNRVRALSGWLSVFLLIASPLGAAYAVEHAPSSPKRPARIVALIDRAENMHVLRLDPDSIPKCDYNFTDSLRFTHCYLVLRRVPAPNEDWAEELGELFARSRMGAWDRDGCGYVPRNIVEIVEENRTSNLVVLTDRCDSTHVGLVMIAPGTNVEYCELRTERKELLELLDRAILLDDAARIEGYDTEVLSEERPRVTGPLTDYPSEGEFVYYDEEPVPLTRAEPTYPVFAREAQIQGKVILHVLVGRDGRVVNVRVTKGVTGLNEAAVDAVKHWVFRPATSGGEPVAVWVEVPMDFHH